MSKNGAFSAKITLGSVLGAAIILIIVVTVFGIYASGFYENKANEIKLAANLAVLPQSQRLALQKDILVYEADTAIKVWSAVIQGSTGLALLVGLFFTWRSLKATQDKLNIDYAALKVTQDKLSVEQNAQVTNRFSMACSQLGANINGKSPNIEARLGAIYALKWLATDDPKLYWQVIAIFTAYVKHNAPVSFEKSPAHRRQNASTPPFMSRIRHSHDAYYKVKPRTDIQAILTFIGEPHQCKEEEIKKEIIVKKIDLRDTNLAGAEFWGAHLEYADFWGANLMDATFWGSHLEHAKLCNANLTRANLKGVFFKGIEVNEGTQFTEAILEKAEIQDANLEKASGLTYEQINSTSTKGVNHGTILPPGIKV
jgi:hypothetical protein